MRLRCCSAERFSHRAVTRSCRKSPRSLKRIWVQAMTDRDNGLRCLTVADLHARYGESRVLHGVDFFVNEGEVVSLLGRNGAGKTTTLKAIMGLLATRQGSIVFN